MAHQFEQPAEERSGVQGLSRAEHAVRAASIANPMSCWCTGEPCAECAGHAEAVIAAVYPIIAAEVLHQAQTAATGVLCELVQERARQDARWGVQNHPDGTGPKVVQASATASMEEHAGHARRECQSASDAGVLTWRHILREEVYEAFAESDPAALRTELVQVAAVAVGWLDAIDRRVAEPEHVLDRTHTTPSATTPTENR